MLNLEASKYKLKIEHEEGSWKVSKENVKDQDVKFRNPVTEAKWPKIYVVKSKGQFLYVGYTSQPMARRLNYGTKANGKTGYYGYKWLRRLSEAKLWVFCAEEEKTFTGHSHQNKRLRLLGEAIEAELVLKIRQETNCWPKYQNEIHFNNYQSELSRAEACKIYKKLVEQA